MLPIIMYYVSTYRLSDPYLVLKFKGKTTEPTETKKKTLYPQYYQTFDFPVVMCSDVEFMPLLSLFAYDQGNTSHREWLDNLHTYVRAEGSSSHIIYAE